MADIIYYLCHADFEPVLHELYKQNR